MYQEKKSPKNGDIIINNAGKNIPSGEKEDGFYLSSRNNQLPILSIPGKKGIYGVVTLLKKYPGVNYFGEFEYQFTKRKNIILPETDLIDNPMFHYRQSQKDAPLTDLVCRHWHRLEQPADVFSVGYWMHIFSKLLPSDMSRKSHPGCFVYFNGGCHPGKASQWYFSYENVSEIVTRRVDSIFKANQATLPDSL